MSELTRSVAGIRGIWGDSLFPATGAQYSAAFAITRKGGKIVVGRDTRKSGEALKHAVISGLLSFGCEVVDAGILPTPSCQLAVEELCAVGGIIITASHNPEQWNGLKFVNSRGEFLNEEEFTALINVLDNDRIQYPSIRNPVPFHIDETVNGRIVNTHIDKICSVIDTERIRGKKLIAVIDAVNGAGSRLIIPLLERLGVDLITLNCKEDGNFPRGAEPMPENLTDLCMAVKKEGAEIGFAVDPDADRLSIVSEQGIPLGEEMTLPLVANHILAREKGVIVTNLSTSMAIDFVAKQHDVSVVRTKIGEANVVSAMKENNCIIGGEGNGGVIVPKIHYARDSGIGIGIILDCLAASGRKISDLAGDIPQYYMVKRKIDCSGQVIEKTVQYFEKHYSGEKTDVRDGLKVIWDDAWLHLRKSGTEGLLRVFAEAMDIKRAEGLADNTLEQVRLFMREEKREY